MEVYTRTDIALLDSGTSAAPNCAKRSLSPRMIYAAERRRTEIFVERSARWSRLSATEVIRLAPDMRLISVTQTVRIFD